MPSSAPQSSTLQQAVVLVVGAPAVELLDGHGEHANTGCDEDATLNEVAQDIWVAGHANRHNGNNTSADYHQPNEGTQEKNYEAQGSLHNGATQPFRAKRDYSPRRFIHPKRYPGQPNSLGRRSGRLGDPVVSLQPSAILGSGGV